VQRDKTNLSGVCKTLIRGKIEMGGWVVVGSILYLLSSVNQMVCVNSPVFDVENNIEKLVSL
jgi:hypothetical protein